MEDLLATARRRRIVERVQKAGTARVVELAADLAVTEETVRRDLKLLDRKGVLTRTHGGAVSNGSGVSGGRGIEESFENRRRQMLDAKKAIAREAARRVQGPLTVALDGSTTAWELAGRLANAADPGLTVVTNSLMITATLAGRETPEVISVGGTLDRKLMLFTGMIASEGLRHLHVDLFFCSCGGIDAARGFFDPSETSAQFKRQFMAVATRTIVLADSTKFRTRTSVLFAKPQDVGELITDAMPDDAAVLLRAAGVRCTHVDVAADDRSPGSV